MVDEEACFLSFQPVDVEVQAVLRGHVVRAAAQQEAVFGEKVGLVGQGGFRFVVDVVYFSLHHLGQGVGYGHAVQVHPGGVGLHHGGAGIDVDDQAGQVVAFAVHQTVSIVVWTSDEADAAAHIQGDFQASVPKVAVDGFVLPEGEHAHGDAPNLEVAFGDEFFFCGVDFHHFAFFGLSVHAGDGAGEHPRVKALQGFLFSGFQVDFIHYI